MFGQMKSVEENLSRKLPSDDVKFDFRATYDHGSSNASLRGKGHENVHAFESQYPFIARQEFVHA